jgi:uncharacterized protein YgbK (DUF1537 family)
MSDKRVLILADDLTGANDTAIQFVKRGLRSLVAACGNPPDSRELAEYDVISINTDSRGMTGDEAYNTVRRVLERFEPSKYLIYKKTDSVLRGNPGRELAAVMDALGVSLAVAAPSFPANRAVLEKGMLYSGGGSGGKDAVRIFASGTGRRTENIPLDQARSGAAALALCLNARNKSGVSVFVVDAVTDEDLRLVYEASTLLEKPHVLAGSAGLANQLAASFTGGAGEAAGEGSRPGTPGFAKSDAPVLVIAGTRQGETAAQIQALSRAMNIPVIRFNVSLLEEGGDALTAAYNEAAGLIQSGAKACVIAVDSMFGGEAPAGGLVSDFAEGDAAAAAISGALGLLTRRLCGEFDFAALVSTGGDTSLAVCRSLEINGIEPLAEICPGIPLGRIAGGAYTGRLIVTKSGRFGDSGALAEICAFLGVTR